MPMYKLVMLGVGGVGKSCLTIQLVNKYFTYEYNPTIENSFRKQLTVDDETCLLEILDTAGQEEYLAMRDQHISQGQGFVLVYAVDNRNTFDQLPQLYNSITRVKESDAAPCVIMGNKADMTDKKVQAQEGKDMAKKLGNSPFFETSAKTRLNVEEGFSQLVRQIRRTEQRSSTPAPEPDKETGEVPAKPVKGSKDKKKSACIIV